MPKILVIPDIHGSNFWGESCADIAQYERIVFLGDYVDSSRFEDVSNQEMLDNFIKIVNFKRDNQDKVILLYGNHDFGYRHIYYVASRFRLRLYFPVKKLLKENENLFQLAHIEKNKILFTHAGISNGWFVRHKNKLSQLGQTLEEQLNFAFKSKYYKMFGEISRLRGGNNPFGSPLWADILETSKDPLNGYIQVVGHTPVEDVSFIEKDKSMIIYCDCHKPYVLEL